MAAGQDSWAAPCRRCRCGTQARRRADRQACTERNSLARRAWRADTQAYTARCNKLARRAHKATAPDSKPPGRTAAVQKHDDESQWINPPSPSRYIQHQHMLQSVLCAPRRSFHTELNGDGAFFQATSLFPAPPPCPWRFPAHTDQKKLRDEQNKTVRISVHSGLKSVPFFQESHTLETVFPPHSRKNRPQRHAAIPVLLPVEALQRPLVYWLCNQRVSQKTKHRSVRRAFVAQKRERLFGAKPQKSIGINLHGRHHFADGNAFAGLMRQILLIREGRAKRHALFQHLGIGAATR